MQDPAELFDAIVLFERTARRELGSRFVGITKSHAFQLLNTKRVRNKGFQPWSEKRFAQTIARLLNLGVLEESRGGISIAAPYRNKRKINAELLKWVELRLSYSAQELEAVERFLKSKKIRLSMLLGVTKEDGKTYCVSTSHGGFLSDDLETWRQLPRTVGYKPGNNATGHRLPASSTGHP